MFLILFIIAICVMIFAYIVQYVSYRRSRVADEVCDLMGLKKYLIEVFNSEYEISEKPYSKEKYIAAAQGLDSTFKQKLSNTLHQHITRSELSRKKRQLKKNPDVDIDTLFPNFSSEIRRVAHVLSEEIDQKFRKEILTSENGNGGKRRRRR